ncbi:carbohydrate ABC transporter permease [Cohnella silvisoli]|uniref:Carbohydrate ABC transporter permease n=1 Tax=Cohnella silvisoli TaxID=2873699 RepID=A0ABV1L5I5_9BACL|nr:carbohydrate ABC transporter permease [Cohnella silvisoli]MCD9026239.1 carbohydrate ABC transporter permease [Cohnella silvisoli]
MTGKSKGMRLAYVYLSLYSVFNLLVFVWIFLTAMKGQSEFFATSPWSPPEAFNLTNFKEAWKVGHIGEFFANSAYVTGISTVVCLVVSSMAAYILGRIPFRGRGIVQLVFMLGMMVPPFMIVIPLFSVLDSLLLLNSLNGLVLVYVTIQIPMNVYVLTSFYRSLPTEFEEAAAIDGASPLRTFFTIMMPLTMPALAACAIINILAFWNEFLFALVFLGDKTKLTLPIGLFYLNQGAEYSGKWTILFAGMAISCIPVLLLLALFQKQFSRGISQGAIKL